MKITSPAFAENANIPKVYAKLGGNQRPPLEINDVPAMDFIIGRFGIYRPKLLK